MRLPFLAVHDGLHELIADADRQVRVLEHDRTVGFAVEVGVVLAAVDQRAGLLLFLGLGLDELQNVRMPVLQDCILAARRVLPPDFTTAAIWS